MPRKDINKDGEKTQFTKNKQPSPKAKKRGHQKKKLLKDIASMVVSGELVNDLKPLAKKLGLDPLTIDVETMMHLRQIEKAIQKGDTSAYNSVMDRLKGRPMQAIDHTSKGQSMSQPILNIDPLSQTEDD